jgi:hypothetical protein
MRSKLVEEVKIYDGDAPSYYIECLIYNVPVEQFGSSYAATVTNCINWLHQTDRTKLVCANAQYWLLGNSNVQWPTEKCDRFLAALVALWNDWGR